MDVIEEQGVAESKNTTLDEEGDKIAKGVWLSREGVIP